LPDAPDDVTTVMNVEHGTFHGLGHPSDPDRFMTIYNLESTHCEYADPDASPGRTAWFVISRMRPAPRPGSDPAPDDRR
jgi:hypothetical protein